MPNWCETNIYITHNDSDKIKALYDRIVEWTSKDCYDNGFGTNWLGNVAGNSGIAKWDEKRNGMLTEDGEFVYCRGSIQYLNHNDNTIEISQEDAWSPILKVWSKVLGKYLPDASLTFDAVETGSNIYATNNPNIEGNYYVDVWDVPAEFSDIEPIYVAEEDDVIELCQRILKTDETNINRLLEKITELSWIFINRWYHSDMEDCD